MKFYDIPPREPNPIPVWNIHTLGINVETILVLANIVHIYMVLGSLFYSYFPLLEIFFVLISNKRYSFLEAHHYSIHCATSLIFQGAKIVLSNPYKLPSPNNHSFPNHHCLIVVDESRLLL
jgi:hypothetical protein